MAIESDLMSSGATDFEDFILPNYRQEPTSPIGGLGDFTDEEIEVILAAKSDFILAEEYEREAGVKDTDLQ